MKRIHIAIATHDVAGAVKDYTIRFGSKPKVSIPGQFALWRNKNMNFSVRYDATCQPGALRHLGWEDPDAVEFTASTDINGITWENFTAQQQAEEIEKNWPGNGHRVTK